MSIEVDGLDELNATFAAAVRAAPAETTRVVSRGALNIKNDWRRAWRGIPHARALRFAVTYDIRQTARGPEAEIGPDKNKRQGPLGNIIEFGTVNSRPHPGGLPALRREGPKYEEALAALCADLLEE